VIIDSNCLKNYRMNSNPLTDDTTVS